MGERPALVHYGLGPIGSLIARQAVARKDLHIVGAIDKDLHKVGRDLGDVIGMGTPLGVTIRPHLADLPTDVAPDVAVHATGSFLDQVHPQLRELLEAGINVVSTCEELACPRPTHPMVADDLDRLATSRDVTVLGTGINPGFAMDVLALTLSAPCLAVSRVHASRVVDASRRRTGLQQKIGAGLNLAAFHDGVRTGSIGHVGLTQSAHLIAYGLGWQLTRVEESIEPETTSHPIDVGEVSVSRGHVAGLQQRAFGFVGEAESIALDLRMSIAANQPSDTVFIDGDPPLRVLIENGLPGDVGTAGMIVNAIPRVLASQPGLTIMPDLSPASLFRSKYGELPRMIPSRSSYRA